jgi:hypothetical protein
VISLKNQDKKMPPRDKKEKMNCPTILSGIPVEPLKSEQTDPFGSYTGNAINNEIPVQDADDL